jgi:hypothetical protein
MFSNARNAFTNSSRTDLLEAATKALSFKKNLSKKSQKITINYNFYNKVAFVPKRIFQDFESISTIL